MTSVSRQRASATTAARRLPTMDYGGRLQPHRAVRMGSDEPKGLRRTSSSGSDSDSSEGSVTSGSDAAGGELGGDATLYGSADAAERTLEAENDTEHDSAESDSATQGGH